NLVWADDASRLLIVASGTNVSKPLSWVLTVADERVTSLPDQSPVASGCIPSVTCYWLGDRYLLHVDGEPPSPSGTRYTLFDFRAQGYVAAGLEGIGITRVDVRGDTLYFSTNAPGTRHVYRFEPATNAIRTAFTTPGHLASEGAVGHELIGGWDLSA